MTNQEAVNWIINISADIGKVQHQELWHYEQALAEIRELLEMPQQQKTGKWIREVLGSTSGYGTTIMYQCTNCEKMSVSKYKFCQNCGARMEREEE